MIDALVRRYLGTSGSVVLDFYLQYSLWINGLLFLYVILLILARRNYSQVVKYIIADFIQEHGDKLSRKSPREVRALVLKWKIPLEKGVQAGWYPFISTPQGLVLYLKSGRTFQKIFPVDILVEAVLQQISPRS